eukprot:gnl/TRDRNA2_/TRDRNA2_188658_c0_seq1.p1 gnl/TRDRNA2_/TRDRNA2_188658_c0~~gnl/TRDRNA2_/TRDRNA2_188658_c0_seq1.p1  ORF type:complete len:169 (+),score=41.33 gnl/TRDRNA2_/TRDRNA2_188658_c0_seq1:59-565(+)
MATNQPKPAPPEHVRCKNFGCQQMFDPTKADQTICIHHKSAPIFHETAKWWSCCPNQKAYDWEEFMKIPGCQRGKCSAEGAAKRHMGGCDVRNANAPVRLDDEIPVDPRKKLDRLRAGLTGIGIEEGNFDRMWGRLAAKHGDLGVVVGKVEKGFAEDLARWSEELERA